MELLLSQNVTELLQTAAADRGLSVNEIAEQAFREYFARTEFLESELREAEVEADREGWLTTDQVFARLALLTKKTA